MCGHATEQEAATTSLIRHPPDQAQASNAPVMIDSGVAPIHNAEPAIDLREPCFRLLACIPASGVVCPTLRGYRTWATRGACGRPASDLPKAAALVNPTWLLQPRKLSTLGPPGCGRRRCRTWRRGAASATPKRAPRYPLRDTSSRESASLMPLRERKRVSARMWARTSSSLQKQAPERLGYLRKIQTGTRGVRRACRRRRRGQAGRTRRTCRD